MLLVVVELPAQGIALEILALVDSGADSTIVDGWPLAKLGVDLTALDASPGISGVGGPVEMRVVEGVMRFEGQIVSSPVHLAPPRSLDGIALLGRADFFRTFAIEFEWYRTPPSFRVDLPPAA